MELKGRQVCFLVKDIYFPAPGEVLDQLHRDDVMSGCVMEVSDGGQDPQAYVVVKVKALSNPVVVPVKRLRDSAVPKE